MKKIVLLLSMVLTSPSYAEVDYETAQMFCKTNESLAEKAQIYRQSGLKPSEATDRLLGFLKNIENTEVFKSIIFSSVQEAYKRPVEQTIELKKKVISEFSNDVYRLCIYTFQNRTK